MKNKMVLLAIIILLLVSGFLYFKINKTSSVIVMQIILLIVTFKFTKQSSERAIPSIFIITSIILLAFVMVEEMRENPLLETNIVDVEFRDIKNPEISLNLENVLIDVININNTFFGYFTEVIKGEINPKIEVINPLNDKVCVTCKWYIFSIKKEGGLDFPLHLYLFSKGRINQLNEDPEASFKCGEGAFSSEKCLVTIHNINEEIKLIFYSNKSITYSFDIKNTKYIENRYHTEVIAFENFERGNVKIKNSLLGEITFPNPKEGVHHYQMNEKGVFIEVDQTTLW